MKRYELTSSCICDVWRHLPLTAVRLRNDLRTYVYFDLPEDLYDELIAADVAAHGSAGAIYNHKIRGKFRSLEITRLATECGLWERQLLN